MAALCSGVILAGGMNSRFSGKDKALLPLGDKRLLDYIYDVFVNLFEDIILVTHTPAAYVEWNLNVVKDIFPVRSSLTGIHAGLFYAVNPYAFFLACDTPFIKPEIIETVISRIDLGSDAVMPELSVGLEPLCAAYSRNSLARIEQHLVQNKFKIRRVFKKNRLKTVSEKTLRRKDPELISFFNINTPQDLLTAEAMASTINA